MHRQYNIKIAVIALSEVISGKYYTRAIFTDINIKFIRFYFIITSVDSIFFSLNFGFRAHVTH